MATKTDKAKWDKLHADLEKAYAAKDDYEIQLGVKYGHRFQLPWLGSGERKKLEQLRDRTDKIKDKVLELIVKISPRGERWMRGAPYWWVARTLTWEDAIRPADEPLSVIVPGSYGNRDGTVTERRVTTREIDRKQLKPGDWIEVRDPNRRISYGQGGPGAYKVVKVGRVNVIASVDVRFSPTGPWHHQEHKIPLHHVVRVIPPNEMRPEVEETPITERRTPARVRSTRATENTKMEIQIPVIEQWRQISGDMDPGTYGGLIAKSDGDQIELIEIQPVREFIGDAEAKDVGFPFWTKEATYDLADLDPNKEETRSAIESMDLDAALEEMAPPQRALAIAEALMRYGYASEEGPAGWSKDVIPHGETVVWWGGTGGAEYIADEDDEFRREVLGEEDDEDDEDDDEDPEDDDDDVFSDDEMREGYTISDGREGGYDVSHEGKHFGDFDSIEDAISEIEVQMKRDNFYPNIYYVNDHGNIDLLDAQGNPIKSRV